MTRVQLVEHASGEGAAFHLDSTPHPLLEPCEPLEGWGLSTYTRCAFRCRYCITGVQGASRQLRLTIVRSNKGTVVTLFGTAVSHGVEADRMQSVAHDKFGNVYG